MKCNTIVAKGISEAHYEIWGLVPLELFPSYNEFMGSNHQATKTLNFEEFEELKQYYAIGMFDW